MKNWFDLAAERHSLMKEAILGAAALSAGKAIASIAGKGAKTIKNNPMKSLSGGVIGLDAASAAAHASGDVARSRRAAQMVGGQGRTF